MPYRPTFAIDAIGRDEPAALAIGLEAMGYLLDALVNINRSHLRRFPNTVRLYSSGVRYDPMDPPEGSACGDDDWASIVDILNTKDERDPNSYPKADCFPSNTLLLKDDHTLVAIEDIQVGDRIWGYDKWTTVEAKVYKGILEVDGVVMNNGSIAQLTHDHHMFVARCELHKNVKADKYGCSCQLADRRIERVSIGDLREYDVLVTPERLPFGTGEMDLGRAYVEGLFVSDGWQHTSNTSFNISGQDGCPKEEQKREVQAICERLGVKTTWHRKSIAVLDADWALRTQQMGHRAPNKRVLSINLEEGAARETLRGVMADSKTHGSQQRGWTFTTTSKLLCVQTRVLQKMMGRQCGYMYIENHGGLGENPIYRLGVQDPDQKSKKLLRVKRVERNVMSVPCYDIQTSDHYVYLPEHDVTVSNCEDLACWRVAELNEIFGIPAKPHIFLRRDYVHVQGERRRRHLYHVVVAWPEGLKRYPRTVKRVDGRLIEDPSLVLGMGRTQDDAQYAVNATQSP